jgi:hypothetical protein
MSKLYRPGRNNPIEMSFVTYPERLAQFQLAQVYFEPKTCSRMSQQAVAFQGRAPATSNPPAASAKRMVPRNRPERDGFLSKSALRLRLEPNLDQATTVTESVPHG